MLTGSPASMVNLFYSVMDTTWVMSYSGANFSQCSVPSPSALLHAPRTDQLIPGLAPYQDLPLLHHSMDPQVQIPRLQFKK